MNDGPEEFCPYVGLQPFGEQDRDYFKGRTRDQKVIVSNLYASNLTVLYGASGVGKSSVLLAGVVPALRESPNTAVAVFRDWARPGYLQDLKRACLDAVARVKPGAALPDIALPFDELLRQAAQSLRITVLVILDQFEEYFLYHPESEAGNPFDEEFARAVNGSDVDLGFLIAMREDGLAKLDRFRHRIPGLLSNTVRLRHLDEAAAREAIRKPLEDVFNRRFPERATVVEPALESALIEEVRGRRVGLTAGAGKAAGGADAADIETALLQLLLTRLWKAEPWTATKPRVLRLQTLHDMGGAEEVVERHLGEILGELSERQTELCARIFDRLVTPSGSKVACREKDLRNWAGDLADELPQVLQRLSYGSSRVLRPVPSAPGDDGGAQFEVFHDVLGAAILDWRADFLAKQAQAALRRDAEAARRRADEQASAAARLRRALLRARVFLALALVTAALAWTFERRAASESRLSSARALAMAAIGQNGTDPELGILLALHGLGQARPLGGEPVREAADALAMSIDASRVRSTRRAEGRFAREPFDPERRRLLLLTDDGHLRLLRWPEGDAAPAQPQGQDAVYVMATFSPSGRHIAAIGQDRHLYVWDAASGERRHRLAVPGDPAGTATTLAFNADDTLLAAGGAPTAWVWRLGDAAPLTTLRGHRDADNRLMYTVVALAFHPQRRLLATAAMDNSMRLWDVDTGAPVAAMTEHAAQIEDIAFSLDGRRLVSASQDGTARIWAVPDAATAAPLRSRVALRGHANSVFRASFSDDGRRIVTASADATVRLWDAADGRELAVLASHSEPVTWARFADADRAVHSGGWDQEVKTWSAGGHMGRPLTLWASPDGRLVASGGDDSDVILWDATRGEELGRLRDHLDGVQALRFSRDGRRLASADGAGRIRLWDVASRQLLKTICCMGGPVTSIDFDATGTRLVAAAPPGGVALFDLDAGRVARTLVAAGHSTDFDRVRFSPDGRWIAAGGTDGSARLWRADGDGADPGRTWPAHGSKVHILSFAPDSATLMTGAHEGAVALWDVASGAARVRMTRHASVAISGVFAPDGASAVTCDLKGTILVWDTKTGDARPGPRAHANSCGVEFSADGQRLLSLSWDRSAKVWDTRSWQEIASYSHGDGVIDGTLLPDGRHLVTLTTAGGLRVMPVDVDELAGLARTRVTRGLSEAECRRHLHTTPCPPLP